MDKWISISIGLIIAMTVLASYSYITLPDTIAVHWNAEGIADGFAPKNPFTIFFVPFIGVGLLGLFLLIVRIEVLKEKWEFHGAYLQFMTVMIGFMFYIQFIAHLWNSGFTLTFNYLIVPGFSGLFLYISDFLGKVKRNFFAGIRTPWTLANDTVWKKTHEQAVWVFRIYAIVMLFVLIIPSQTFIIFIALLLLGIAYLVFYSYWEYRKIEINQLASRKRKKS
jgi:uncharacterized membrane protein